MCTSFCYNIYTTPAQTIHGTSSNIYKRKFSMRHNIKKAVIRCTRRASCLYMCLYSYTCSTLQGLRFITILAASRSPDCHLTKQRPRFRHENPHVTCTLLCTWYTKKAYMVRKKGVHGPVEKM